MQRILVLRPGALGDALLSFPVLKALREAYIPEPVSLTLVSHPAILPLALAWGIADAVEDYTAMRWSELFSTDGIHTPELRVLLAQTTLAICWLRDAEGLVRRNLQATGCPHIISAPGRPAEATHEHIVRYLGKTLDLELDEARPFTLASGLTPRQQAELTGNQPGPRQTLALHPGSGGKRKCWPTERFAEVIRALQQQHVPLLLLSGPAEEERQCELQLLLSGGTQGLCRLENAPLLAVCQALEQCSCYLGNDAGMTHLAALYGLPTTVLFGPTSPEVWRPVGPLVSVVYEQHLEQLSSERVLALLQQGS